MAKAVALSYVEILLAKRPKDHHLIVMMSGDLYEVSAVRYGALVVRSAKDFKLTDEKWMETQSRDITNYWYLGGT